MFVKVLDKQYKFKSNLKLGLDVLKGERVKWKMIKSCIYFSEIEVYYPIGHIKSFISMLF